MIHLLHLVGALPLYQRDNVPNLSAGVGTIWLDDLNCAGNETQLTSCASPTSVGQHNCVHTEDVGVRCEPRGFRGKAMMSLNTFSDTSFIMSVIITD